MYLVCKGEDEELTITIKCDNNDFYMLQINLNVPHHKKYTKIYILTRANGILFVRVWEKEP